MKTKYFFLVLSVFILFIGCNKDDEDETPVPEATATLVVYALRSDFTSGYPVTVTVSGNEKQLALQTIEPTCDTITGVGRYTLIKGTYIINCTSGNLNWTDTVTLAPGQCLLKKVDYNPTDYYELKVLKDIYGNNQITVETPHQVNILFQILDYKNIGVPGLTTDKFIIKENDQVIGSEASAVIAPFGDIPTEIKTVLVLDNSISVTDDLDKIKEAAIALINTIGEKQKFAIYTFSSTHELVQDFSNNVSLLTNAINSIEIGTSSTNLYGTIIETADLWEDSYTIDNITIGNLIVLTDGDDTQASSTLSQAKQAVAGKTVYMLGLGNELNKDIMEQLGKFYNASDVTMLEAEFAKIQDDIDRNSRSVYWLYYQSPKRGNNNHTLTLEISENANTDYYTNSITGAFSSSTFYDE